MRARRWQDFWGRIRHACSRLLPQAAPGVFIFVIPVNRELDLKKAAAAVGEKSVAMLPVAKLVQTVGYARGACSPIGMKKQFVTVFDASALTKDKIFISGGQLGSQICLKPEDAIGISCAQTADITR